MTTAPLTDAARRTRRLIGDFGIAIRHARRRRGWSQAKVASLAGMSRGHVGRIERGQVRSLTVRLATRLAAVVHLDLVLRLYENGGPIRDVAHAGLLAAFDRVVGPGYRVHGETPVGQAGDVRAWDRLLSGPIGIGVEAEMRLEDAQSQEREMILQQRDSGVRRMILVLPATTYNRSALRSARPALRVTFPLGTRDILDSLRAGVDPGGNGIVLLSYLRR